MIKESLSNALSKQVNFEFESAYLYLSMSSYCNRKGFMGFANWLSIQAQEEMAHAMHLYQYVLDRGATPLLTDIKASTSDYKDMVFVFSQVLAHEEKVSDEINKISTLAMQENDHSAYQFMQWYVNEQVEEVANAELILQKLQHIGDNSGLQFVLDNELASRVFVDPFGGQTA